MTYLKSITLLTLLLIGISGCGGDSEEPMREKRYIVILKNVPSGVCESAIYRDTLESYGFEDLLTKETATDTSCDTYDKTNDGEYCAEAEYDSGDVNCVVGFNDYSGNYDDLSFRKSSDFVEESGDLDIVTHILTEAVQKIEK